MLPRIGMALIALAMAGCERAPGYPINAMPAPVPQAEIWEKPGAAFRAEWTWSSSAPGTALVNVTVVPKRAGESLRIHAKLPKGVGLTAGDVDRAAAPVSARTPVTMSFEVAFAPDLDPLIPVEILLVVSEGHRSAATLPVRDRDAPRPKRAEKPGTTTDVGGFPARVGGEMEPSKH